MFRYFLGGLLVALAAVLLITLGLAAWRGDSSHPDNAQKVWGGIAGRDSGEAAGGERPLIYRACIPRQWQRYDPQGDSSIAATTEPICTFIISDSRGDIRLTIHNFPYDDIDERVDPRHQVARWQQQLGPCDPFATKITKVHGGGFTGLQLSAEGLVDDVPTGVLAWSMQLAPEYFFSLKAEGTPYNRHFIRQLAADYTIKAVGSPESVMAHYGDIDTFASSFELIYELPSI